MSVEPLSPLKAARWQKILDAAETLFVTQGFRGTTMEGIADAVGMSKVTVYGYARDKDAVFAAVADRLADRLQQATDDAFAGEGSVRDRIEVALVSKHRIVHDLVRSSPFAKDLFAEKDRARGARFAALDRAIEDNIAALLHECVSDRSEARRLASLLFNASQGIANGGANFDTIAQDIRLFVRALVPNG